MTSITATWRRNARLPIGLAGMIAIVAAIEGIAGGLSPRSTSALADVWADAYRQAGTDDLRGATVLCLGDSQVKLGLNARELGHRLGLPAYNLALHAGQPAAAEALLRRALDAGANPGAILVGFSPDVLAFEARTNLRQWPEVLGPLGMVRLALEARDGRLATAGLLAALVPTYRARVEVGRDLRAALDGAEDPIVSRIVAQRLDRWENRGSVVAPARPGFRDESGPTAVSRWWPRSENGRAARRLLGLASGRGIAVFWVALPTSPAESSRRRESGLEAAYGRFLDRLRDEFPSLTVLDARRLGLDRGVFLDQLHVDGDGGLAVTSAVASAMIRGASGWVSLGLERAESARLAGGISIDPSSTPR